MACSGPYATADQMAEYFCTTISEEQTPMVNRTLTQAAGMIHAARAAQNGCDCTLAGWASDYLKNLNILLAAVVFRCKCSNINLTQDEKTMFAEMIRNELTLIREGKIELCAGATGADYPVTGWANQGVSEWARAQIILNDYLVNSG